MREPMKIQPYCMYREPNKFKKMQCHTDEFHGLAGHKCGPLYSVSLLKDSTSRLAKINDSSIEQMNRTLKLIKISAQYMNLNTFNDNVEDTLEVANRRQIRKRDKQIVY